MRVLVYGLGRSGTAVARLLIKQGHEVVTFDQQPRESERVELSALGCRATSAPAQEDVALCIAAPGVPFFHPDLVALRARGIETIGEVEWVYRSVKADIVGVTGTAGKTTVTRWISDTLSAAGWRAPAGGNISPALASVAEEGALLIAELSSFQLERCSMLRPKVAVLLNVGRDHLDRHGSLEAYHAAKRQLLKNLSSQEALVYNVDDPLVRAWAEASPARRLGFSLEQAADAYLAGEMLWLHGAPLLSAAELQLKARHHLANALAVALCCDALGLELKAIQEGLKRFRGVPGRYHTAGSVGNVHFVEDSIATRTLAVKAALEATPRPIVWIGGGVDKGAEFEALEGLVKDKVVLFIGVGRSGPDYAARLKHLTATLTCDEADGEAALRCACRLGYERLREEGGGTVLLAPLAASFDQFEDYQHRAAAFRRAVAALQAEEGAAWIQS
jgi:UDP-N-acetylmuramoylalanine--D-glutamate ligase